MVFSSWKAMTIVGEGSDSSILDGGNYHQVVSVYGSGKVVFDGLAVKNGWMDGMNSNSCSGGMLGKSQPNEGSATCDPCEAGTFQPDEGASTCEKCAIGKAESNTGATSNTACVDCIPGKWSSAAGASMCDACQSGMFSIGGTECMNCAKNTFAPNTGSSSCELCPSGKTSEEGASSCDSSTSSTLALIGAGIGAVFVGMAAGFFIGKREKRSNDGASEQLLGDVAA